MIPDDVRPRTPMNRGVPRFSHYRALCDEWPFAAITRATP
jgi:hypothetical protein